MAKISVRSKASNSTMVRPVPIAENSGDSSHCHNRFSPNRNSAKSLGRITIQKGVLAFVGFGDIPTDFVETVPFSKRSIAIYKGLITRIMKYALYWATKENMSIDSFIRVIHILTTKEIQHLLMTKSHIQYKSSIINQLIQFKNDIQIFGNRYVTIY